MSAAAAADGTNLREIDGRQVRCNLVGRRKFCTQKPVFNEAPDLSA